MNTRDSVYINDFHTADIPGCTLLDITEPESPKFRHNKQEVIGVDGYFHDAKLGTDGNMGELIFETVDDAGFRALTNRLYPGFYGEIAIDYQYPLYRLGTVVEFSVEEIGFAEGLFYRVTTFRVDYQPFLRARSTEIALTNGQTVHNPGAYTNNFVLEVLGTTTQEGAWIRMENGAYDATMTVRVTGKLTIDNARKNLYDMDDILKNDYRISGFYFSLHSGDTKISWGTGIASVKLTTNWRYWA